MIAQLRTRFTDLCSCVIAAFLVVCPGCTGTRPTDSAPNPLIGWDLSWSQDPAKLDRRITDDYEQYIKDLPAEQRDRIGPIRLFEDGTGQHAVSIEIAINGTDLAHVLFYDPIGRRVRVIKYTTGHYRS